MTWPPVETPLVKALNEVHEIVQSIKRDLNLGHVEEAKVGLARLRSRVARLRLIEDSD